jgi:chromate transporter
MGSRLHGPLGAAAGLLALMGAPVAIALALGWIYVNFGHAGAVDAILRGVAPVAAGLMLATGIKVAMAYSWRNRLSVFAVLSFVAIALFRVSLPVMLLALVPAALLLAWHRRRGARATG